MRIGSLVSPFSSHLLLYGICTSQLSGRLGCGIAALRGGLSREEKQWQPGLDARRKVRCTAAQPIANQPVKILLKGSQLAEASMHDPVFSPFGTFGDVGGYYMIFLSESCQTATHLIRPKTVAVE